MSDKLLNWAQSSHDSG